jgi:hypothetical protein
MKKDINLSRFNINIHNLEPIEFGGYYALISEDYDEKLKDDIKIAIAMYYTGLKSFNYAKQKYFNANSKSISKKDNNPYKILLNRLTNSAWKIISDINNSLNSIELKEESDITLGLVSTFGRLINSYETSIFLIKTNYYFESISINRLIFEQLNYCFNLIHLSKNDFKSNNSKILRQKLSPTDINKLKKFIPDSQIGQFYSYLSEVTHIDFRQIGKYLSYSDTVDGYTITMKSIEQSIESALILMKLVDIHAIVFEYTFKDFADFKFSNIVKKENRYLPKPERQTKKLLIKYNEAFLKLLKEVDIPIEITDKRKRNDTFDLPF